MEQNAKLVILTVKIFAACKIFFPFNLATLQMILVVHGLVVSVFLYAFCSWTNGQQSEKAQYGMSEKILPLPHKVKIPKKVRRGS